jgi:hypothetical protein
LQISKPELFGIGIDLEEVFSVFDSRARIVDKKMGMDAADIFLLACKHHERE